MKRKHMARVAAVASICVVGTVLVPADAALAATPVGNGSCDSGNYCEYKHGNRGLPVADWSGDSNKRNYNDFRYFNHSNDSPNDEVSWIRNRDGNAQQVFLHAGFGGRSSCFPTGYDSTNTKGMEDEASSHRVLASSQC